MRKEVIGKNILYVKIPKNRAFKTAITRERDGLWSGWFWLWILIPIVLIIVVIMKVSKGGKLDNEIRDLKDRIREMEREQ